MYLIFSRRISTRSSRACLKALMITVGCICCCRKGSATDSISPPNTIQKMWSRHVPNLYSLFDRIRTVQAWSSTCSIQFTQWNQDSQNKIKYMFTHFELKSKSLPDLPSMKKKNHYGLNIFLLQSTCIVYLSSLAFIIIILFPFKLYDSEYCCLYRRNGAFNKSWALKKSVYY